MFLHRRGAATSTTTTNRVGFDPRRIPLFAIPESSRNGDKSSVAPGGGGGGTTMTTTSTSSDDTSSSTDGTTDASCDDDFDVRRSGGREMGMMMMMMEDEHEIDDVGIDDASRERNAGGGTGRTMTAAIANNTNVDETTKIAIEGYYVREIRRLERLNATLSSNLAILTHAAFGEDGKCDDDVDDGEEDDEDLEDDVDDEDDDIELRDVETTNTPPISAGTRIDGIVVSSDGGRGGTEEDDAVVEAVRRTIDVGDGRVVDSMRASSSSSPSYRNPSPSFTGRPTAERPIDDDDMTSTEERYLRKMAKLRKSNDGLRRKLDIKRVFVTRLLCNLKIAADKVSDVGRERDEWKFRYENTTAMDTASTTTPAVAVGDGDDVTKGRECNVDARVEDESGRSSGRKATTMRAVEDGLVELLRLVNENEMARAADRAYLLGTYGDDDERSTSMMTNRTHDIESIDEILNRISRELRGGGGEGNDRVLRDATHVVSMADAASEVGSDRAYMKEEEGGISSSPPPSPPSPSPLPSGRGDVMTPSGEPHDRQRQRQHPSPSRRELNRGNVDVDEHPMCGEIKTFDRSVLRKTPLDHPDYSSSSSRPLTGEDVISFLARSKDDDVPRERDVDRVVRDIDHDNGGCDTGKSSPFLGSIRGDEDRYDAIGGGIDDDDSHVDDYDIEPTCDDGGGNDDAERYEDIGDVVDREDDVLAPLEADVFTDVLGVETIVVEEISIVGGNVDGSKIAMHRDTPNDEGGEKTSRHEKSIGSYASLSKDEMAQREFPVAGESDDDTDKAEDLVDGVDEPGARLNIIEDSAAIKRDDSHDSVDIEEETRFLLMMREQNAIENRAMLQESTGHIESDPSSNEGPPGSMCIPGGEEDIDEGGTTAAIDGCFVGESTEQIRDYGSDYDDDDDDGMYNAREPKGEDNTQQQLFEKIAEHLHTGYFVMETKDEDNNHDRAFSSGADSKKDGSDDNDDMYHTREPNGADKLHQQSFGHIKDHLHTGCIAVETKDEVKDDDQAFSEPYNSNDDDSNDDDEADAKVETSQPKDNVGSLIQTDMSVKRSVNHDDSTILDEIKDLNPAEDIILEKNLTQPHAIATDEAPCIEVLTGSEETFGQYLNDSLERIQEQIKARLEVTDKDPSIAYCEHIEAQYTKPSSTKAQQEDSFSHRLSRRTLFQRKGSLELILDVAKNSFLSPRERQVLVVSKDNDKYLVPRYGPPILPPQTSKTGAPLYKKGQKDSGYYIYISSSGNKYAGNFKDGARHGYGIATYHDGEVFNGEWRRGRRHGRGVLHLANCEVFDGTWSANKKHGLGVYYWTDGEVDVSWYEDNVRLESLRWTRDRRRAYLLDLSSPKKEPISLDRAASIVQDWERKHGEANVPLL